MSHVREVVEALEAVADTRIVWANGLMNSGGPHRRLASSISPISIGEDECELFGRLVAALEPRTCFIVGNAFGFSSAYIAKVMQAHGGEHVVTLDAQTEGDGERCAAIARQLTERIDTSILKNKKGFSPRDLPQAVESDDYDLIFIDGCHGHPAVSDDFEGLKPYARPDTVFVWHDFWFPGVRHSVKEAVAQGYRCLWVPTSCEMVLGCLDDEMFARLSKTFPEGDSDPDSHFSLPRYAVNWWAKSLSVYLRVFAERITGASPERQLPSASNDS